MMLDAALIGWKNLPTEEIHHEERNAVTSRHSAWATIADHSGTRCDHGRAS